MFRYIDTPFIRYSQYRPIITYRPRYIRRPNPINGFYHYVQQMNTIEQLERIAEKNALYNLYLFDQAYRKSNDETLESKEEHQNDTQEDSDNKETKENKEGKQEIATPSQKLNIRPKQTYYSEIRTKYCNGKYFEEKREVAEDHEGLIHHKQIRKIGDRWYEQEKTTNQLGEISSKEQWHNVSEEEIDQFKEDWYSQSGFTEKSNHQEALAYKDNNKADQQDMINFKDECSHNHLMQEEKSNAIKESEPIIDDIKNISSKSIDDNNKETQTNIENSLPVEIESNTSIPNNETSDKIE